MYKVLGFVRIIRPLNCLVMGFAVLVGMLASLQGYPLPGKIILRIPLSYLTGFTFLAAANVVNDYYDRKIDAINEPTRPIPRGVVTPKEALVYTSILSVVGFITAFLTSIPCFLVATLAWVLSIFYATEGKRTGFLGNLIVSACIALPFIYGGFAVEMTFQSVQILVLFTFTAFFSNTGREITKGIVDMQGDQLQRVNTLAISFGPHYAAIVATSFYLVTVVLSFFPWVFGMVYTLYLPLIVVADVGLIWSSISLLRNFTRENAKRVKNLVRVWMVMGLLAFIIGTFRF